MLLFRQPDLILLHPPSVYDFRKRPIMFGPISDVVPSTAIFEMYPFGFTTMAEYLTRHGFRVRIINVALGMLKSPAYDPERHIQGLRPRAFGIDLHWLPHAQGSLEVAKICKQYHPEIPVILGGFSSSYFYRELMEKPEVDFIIRGDSTEEPLRMLMKSLSRGERRDFSVIPNLVWKTSDGKVVVNELTHIPETLDHYDNSYGNMIRSAIRNLDIRGMLPIHDWWSYPVTAVMTCRGCEHACSFCGGSRPGLKVFGNRNRPAFRSPDRIASDILSVTRFTSAPIFVVGDLRHPGEDYAEVVLSALDGKRVRNQVVLELFDEAPGSYFKRLAEVFLNYNLEMSPESHDPEVRKLSGKHYSNEELEDTIKAALDAGCRKFDLFFMVGLPKQTPNSVMESIDYIELLLERFAPRLVPFISPLAPFIDPGSPIYENPEAFGYTLFHKSLEEFRGAMLGPSWKYALSYETQWLSREQIVNVTYEAALRLNRLKTRFGLIDAKISKEVEDRILLAKETMEQIDTILELPQHEREKALEDLRLQINRVNTGTLCEEREIKWPLLARNFRFLRIAWSLLKG